MDMEYDIKNLLSALKKNRHLRRAILQAECDQRSIAQRPVSPQSCGGSHRMLDFSSKW